jgi:hypothetical protein
MVTTCKTCINSTKQYILPIRLFMYLIWFLQQTDIDSNNVRIFVMDVLYVFCELLNEFQNALLHEILLPNSEV